MRIRKWPYILVPIAFGLLIFTILLLMNLLPKSPWVSLLAVLAWPFIITVLSFIISFVIYREQAAKYEDVPEIRGLSQVTNEQAERLLIRYAKNKFRTNFTTEHDFARATSMRVGLENTDVFVTFVKQSSHPSTLYVALAVSKQNPSDWNYETVEGKIDKRIRDEVMKRAAESLAADPPGKDIQTIEEYDPATGRTVVRTSIRPTRIRQFAGQETEKQSLV